MAGSVSRDSIIKTFFHTFRNIIMIITSRIVDEISELGRIFHIFYV